MYVMRLLISNVQVFAAAAKCFGAHCGLSNQLHRFNALNKTNITCNRVYGIDLYE